jgi:dihydroflavonol-4-reductase
MKSIFVTGGTGLVGSHLLYALTAMGEKPIAIYRTEAKKDFVRKVFSYYSDNPEIQYRSVEWIRADIEIIGDLKKAMQGSDDVFHCAAEVSFDPSKRNLIIEKNVQITRNIVDLCLELGVRKLCHVSSVAALGAIKEGVPVNENQKWEDSDHHSAYAQSKYLSEVVVWEGIKKGLSAVIVNPSVIFGPGDWNQGSTAFFSGIRKGMFIYTRGITGYVDVRDVANSMIQLINSNVSGERFIISSENLSFYEVFSMIAGNLGVKKPFIYFPKVLSIPALGIIKIASWLAGKKSAITSDNLRSAYSVQLFDNSKIKRETGISFMPVRQSVEDTCRIYLRELLSGK